MDKDTLIIELIAKVDMLTKRVEQLEHFEAENSDLKRRLSKYEHPKNSNNSSIPPSKDENLMNAIQSAKTFAFLFHNHKGHEKNIEHEEHEVLHEKIINHKGHEEHKVNHEEYERIININHEEHKEHEGIHEGNINGELKIGAVKSETILKASVLSILVFGMFAYPTEILPIKMVATLCIALLAGMAMPLLTGKENSFVKKPSCPLSPSWLNSFLHLKLNLWLKLSLTLATVFAIVLLLPQANKLHQAYATWNDAYQLYNYNLYAECLEEYKKALPVLQHNGEFLLNYGKALSIAEKHPEALEILNRASPVGIDFTRLPDYLTFDVRI